MTLLQLKYIVKIVECGSMNEASHELYVSQPALSSSVKELENELGIEIFVDETIQAEERPARKPRREKEETPAS